MTSRKELLNKLKANSTLSFDELTKEEIELLDKFVEEGLADGEDAIKKYCYTGKYLKYDHPVFIDTYCELKGDLTDFTFESPELENVSDETFTITLKCNLKNTFFVAREDVEPLYDEIKKLESRGVTGEEYLKKYLEIMKKHSANTFVIPAKTKVQIYFTTIFTEQGTYFLELYINGVSMNHHEFFKVEGTIFISDNRTKLQKK